MMCRDANSSKEMNGSRSYWKQPFARKTAITSLLTLLWAIPGSFAGSVAAPYEVGMWEGFRPAAISYTFDDNLASQYSTAVPMFHAAGFRMTLNTVITLLTHFTLAHA